MKPLAHILIVLAGWATSPVQAQEVYRCGNTYSHEPCKGAKVVDTAPAITDPQGPKTKLIYLCKRPDKSELWWIHEECSRRSWTVVDSVRVPADISWDEQVEIARQKRSENSYRPTVRPSYNSAASSSNSSECDALTRRVNELDSMARAGGTAQRMEWIRQERQSTRDRQFQIGC